MSKLSGNKYRTTIVCIDSYQEDVLQGRIYNPFMDGGEPFQSVMQFLKKMENLLDEMCFPQSFTAKREFAPIERPSASKRVDGTQRGKLITFSVKVLFRQWASWQGSIVWLETGSEASFRSALELLFLMDSAINAQKKRRTPFWDKPVG